MTYQRYLVTGGAGFIGSHFLHLLLRERPQAQVAMLDKLTYAGNPANLGDLLADPRFQWIRGDITEQRLVEAICREFNVEVLVNFAAESHVDRSLIEADSFIHTDIVGTYALLEVASRWPLARYTQISTDEVYGEVLSGAADEEAPLAPRSPYSASKGAADLLVHGYTERHGLDSIIVRGSNNFGPAQYPEKFLPLCITNALEGLPLPIYGDGLQMRDWIYVEDFCAGILTAIEHGSAGAVYNVGAGTPRTNIEVARHLLRRLGRGEELIEYVSDRPGHDRRYSIDSTKLRGLGWTPQHEFWPAIDQTIAWYQEHRDWWEPIRSSFEFRRWWRRNYEERAIPSPESSVLSPGGSPTGTGDLGLGT